MKQRDGEPQHLLHRHLDLIDRRVGVRLDLVVEVVFAEREDGDEIRAGADGELDEAHAALEDEAQGVGLGVEGLAGAADDDGDGAAHALAVGAAAAEQIFAGLARHGGEAQQQGVVAVEGDAEVGVEGEEGVGDAGEEVGEAEGVGGEGGEGPVADDAVRVVAEDVFAGGGEGGGAVEPRGEVRGEERPDGEAAEDFGAVGQVAGGAGVGEEDVDCVREEEGPEEGDGAEEEEEAEEAGDAEGVHEDDEGLESSFQGHVHGSESHTVGFGVSGGRDGAFNVVWRTRFFPILLLLVARSRAPGCRSS